MNKFYNELNKQKQIIEDMGYRVAYICLYGSQNYGLEIHSEEYQSDIDMKAIIVPSLKDLINNTKPVSTVIETEWGQCDLKDIRIYFDKGILKANPVYIETLYTEYYIIDELFKDEFEYIRAKRDDLVEVLKCQMIRAMYGMMCEKKKAMCHPYPTIKHKIDKYGYDGKQVHHIYRIMEMMLNYYTNGRRYEDCISDFSDIQYKQLMDYKLNNVGLETAINSVGSMMSIGLKIKTFVLNNIDENKLDYSLRDEFKEIGKLIIENKIVDEIKKGDE